MAEIYLHIDARIMADYIHTHPYIETDLGTGVPCRSILVFLLKLSVREGQFSVCTYGLQPVHTAAADCTLSVVGVGW